ncbi:MAG TPA: tRNA lysidine(34) synthetase TilS [bacterium]|nr:tRNA lysidine(34) synthetase TilS [bacterium]
MGKSLHEFIRKNMELAVTHFNMIQPGDRILLGLSGGVDSFVLLSMLHGRKVFITDDFSVTALHIDLGFTAPDFSHLDRTEEYLRKNNFRYRIEKTTIGVYAHSEQNKKKPCFTCSRWRRKRMIEIADELGCNKIALGHHKDDVIETLLINLFFGREISTINPNQELFKGKFHIIRPFVYIWERKLKRYANYQNFPWFDNPCPSTENTRRAFIKKLLNDLQKSDRLIKENIFKALYHVKHDYLWS